jgi:hypothetical protein
MRLTATHNHAIDQLAAVRTQYRRRARQEEVGMALEQFRVQVAMLMDEIAKAPQDAHELQEQLREKLAEMQALGLPLPDDLVDLEEYLEEGLEPDTHTRPGGRRPPKP